MKENEQKSKTDIEPAVVNALPPWVNANEISREEIEYKGEKFPYSIFKKEAKLELPGFLGHVEGHRHFFISEEVPENFKKYQLIHEVIEYTELNGKIGRCVEALNQEIALVPEDIKQEYLKYRRDFFARLVEYYKNYEDEEFKAEIQKSFEFLKKLIPE